MNGLTHSERCKQGQLVGRPSKRERMMIKQGRNELNSEQERSDPRRPYQGRSEEERSDRGAI
jgi:hypothetical protein